MAVGSPPVVSPAPRRWPSSVAATFASPSLFQAMVCGCDGAGGVADASFGAKLAWDGPASVVAGACASAGAAGGSEVSEAVIGGGCGAASPSVASRTSVTFIPAPCDGPDVPGDLAPHGTTRPTKARWMRTELSVAYDRLCARRRKRLLEISTPSPSLVKRNNSTMVCGTGQRRPTQPFVTGATADTIPVRRTASGAACDCCLSSAAPSGPDAMRAIFNELLRLSVRPAGRSYRFEIYGHWSASIEAELILDTTPDGELLAIKQRSGSPEVDCHQRGALADEPM